VWLVELAPVGDPDAVADAVASALGVTPHAGSSVADSVAAALSGRQMLVVVDNCEHVLGTAGEVVEKILDRTREVKILATSREGLQAAGEHLWPVPSLNVAAGVGSAAVELFVDRARAVVPGFGLGDPDDAGAVIEICQRLDGMALAIELAAARMVAMSPQDVRDRLDERFRLLSGPRRGLARHQTLRQAVGWSYDLLGEDERLVLNRVSVFAGGFDLAVAVGVVGQDRGDEYALLDLVESLVRKSLVVVERVGGHARYGLSETIRQFAEEQLAATGTIGEIRNRHARYFARLAVDHWGMWDGPGQRVAVDWVELEFANLRAGFRWAGDQHDLETAAAIAAHAAMLGQTLQRYEPAGWAEEILEAAQAAQLPQLPRLYTAASFSACTPGGQRKPSGIRRLPWPWVPMPATTASIPPGRAIGRDSRICSPTNLNRYVEICVDLAAQPGPAHILGQCGLLLALPLAGRDEEARAMAEDTLAAARAHANPWCIALALDASGRAFAPADPAHALGVLYDGLAYAKQHRLQLFEAAIALQAASLEALHGDPRQALALFDAALDSLQRAGNAASLGGTLANLAVCFGRFDRPDVAGTLYGASNPALSQYVVELPAVMDHLRAALGAPHSTSAPPPEPPWTWQTPSATPDTTSNWPAAKLPTPISVAPNRLRIPQEPAPEDRSGYGWCPGWQLDLHPDPVARSADDSGVERSFLVVSNPDSVSRTGVKSRVAGPRPTTKATFDHQIGADLVRIVSQVVGILRHRAHGISHLLPTHTGFLMASEKCRRTLANCVGLGSESTTVQWGWSFEGRSGKPSAIRSSVLASITHWR
jgi:predicted ATPase